MQTVQTKQTVEGIVLNAYGIEKESVNMTKEMIKKRKKTNKVSISKDSNLTEDNIGKQMHVVQAKERGASIDPNESVTEKEEVGNQAENTNPEPPKESVQLEKEIGVQQTDETIDDPYAPSQYCLDFSPMEVEKTRIQTTKKIEAEVGEGARRALNLGQHLRSPYVKRIVDISALQNKDEKMVCNWILAGLEPSNDIVSETTSFKTFRGAMEALVAGLPILVNVIDSWIFVLNDEEKYINNEAMRRIFFNTKVGIMNETLQMQTRFDVFNANLTAAAPLKETVTMRNIDLNPAVVIIDNNANDDEVENIYGRFPSNLLKGLIDSTMVAELWLLRIGSQMSLNLTILDFGRLLGFVLRFTFPDYHSQEITKGCPDHGQMKRKKEMDL
ncbi:hypothetical protein L6452_34993 [Arctium lappa]|uniref:Uncharacterized protein n=1 Tax=Arctium lappa TaxID=4217 RepID=A0ACB8YNZ2_ARCLA|nr:hypothetical protein L6452_34993 [Arctium lappa]